MITKNAGVGRLALLAVMVACLQSWPALAQAQESSVVSGAREVGAAVGTGIREVGVAGKEIGKTIGKEAAEAGKEIGRVAVQVAETVGEAAKEGGKALVKGVKGE